MVNLPQKETMLMVSFSRTTKMVNNQSLNKRYERNISEKEENMKEIINNNINIILIYLAIINTLTFLIMAIDKYKAKRARRRIPEKTLFTFVFLGGGIGGIIAMYTIRHKNKKIRFVIGFPLILILEIVTFFCVYFMF